MATSDTALSLLRDSRDGARIWHDNGRTVARLAKDAGVRVEYAHVELGHKLTTERRTVEVRAVTA